MAGPLLKSDGSSEWQAGNASKQIRLACSVNGPLEVKYRDELPQQASIELVYRRNVGLPMIRERLIQDRLHTCLLAAIRRDLMPRSLVQVVVQLLEAWQAPETSVVASMEDQVFFAEVSESVNAMTLAVLNAGVPSRGVVTAASYAITNTGVVPVVELTKATSVKSLHAIAYIFNESEEPKVVMCESLGSFSQDELLDLLEKALGDTRAVYDRMRELNQA